MQNYISYFSVSVFVLAVVFRQQISKIRQFCLKLFLLGFAPNIKSIPIRFFKCAFKIITQ